MKKVNLFVLAICSLLVLSEPFTVFAEEINIFENVRDGDVSPQADIIEWRYKTINGKLHRRQYNYSKEKWIGSWMPV